MRNKGIFAVNGADFGPHRPRFPAIILFDHPGVFAQAEQPLKGIGTVENER